MLRLFLVLNFVIMTLHPNTVRADCSTLECKTKIAIANWAMSIVNNSQETDKDKIALSESIFINGIDKWSSRIYYFVAAGHVSDSSNQDSINAAVREVLESFIKIKNQVPKKSEDIKENEPPFYIFESNLSQTIPIMYGDSNLLFSTLTNFNNISTENTEAFRIAKSEDIGFQTVSIEVSPGIFLLDGQLYDKEGEKLMMVASPEQEKK